LEPALIVYNDKILSKNCLQILWNPPDRRNSGLDCDIFELILCDLQAVALFLCNTFSSSKGSEWLMYSSTWKIDEVKKINRDSNKK
jgi:hypothetical protein